MYPIIENPINISDSLPAVKILLAESDPSTIAQIISNTDRELQGSIQVSKNYYDLLERITEEAPDLLLLGKIDNFNCFDICQECHKIRDNLSIILLSKQSVIDSSFRQLALSKGATDIITNDPIQLNQLFEKLHRLASSGETNSNVSSSLITGEMMLVALQEIAAIASNYFGALAQGNYWRKAHDRIVDEFPSLANWSADHFGKLGCNDNLLGEELTAEEVESLRIWVSIFIEECQRIIVDFGAILAIADLSDTAKQLLAQS
jgi:CheY-like chemotaxis protein